VTDEALDRMEAFDQRRAEDRFEASPNNVKVLVLLDQIITKSPSLRVLQVLGNAIPSEVAERYSHDMYSMPEDELVGYLKDYIELVSKT